MKNYELRITNYDCSNRPQDGVSYKRRNIASVFLAVLILLPKIVFASGDGAARLYNQGNAAFTAGKLDDAIRDYTAARGQDADDARLDYNLGCAYLKAGKLGEAIRHLEMARMRAPRDKDILFNLAFAKSQTLDALPEESPSVIERLGAWPLRGFTENELFAGAACALFAALLILGVAWPHRRGMRGRSAVIVGCVLIGLTAISWIYAGLHHHEYGGHRAVVGAAELAVKSGPGLDNPTVFTVHEGMEAVVREKRGTWALIVIPTGFSGWAPTETVLPVG